MLKNTEMIMKPTKSILRVHSKRWFSSESSTPVKYHVTCFSENKEKTISIVHIKNNQFLLYGINIQKDVISEHGHVIIIIIYNDETLKR